VKTFHLPAENWREPYVLEGREARHAVKVMRLSAGDVVRLMDGRGRSGEFRITRVSKSGVDLEPMEIVKHEEPSCRVRLAVGWVKSKRRSWLLEKAVELGAWEIIFWQGVHSQGRVPDEPKDTWRDKLAEAVKQCGNPWRPRLAVMPGGAAELAEKGAPGVRRYLLWEAQDRDERPGLIDPHEAGAPGETLFVVGPEGGFAPEEVRTLADAGFSPVSLGRRVLRYETAALACLALAWWGAEKNGVIS
jgi:16S rRNA (uracil1498-N3)-methyltransferase